MTHSCLPIETCLFLASCYSSFSLFKQSLTPLNYDFWWNLRGVLHGEGAGMGTHPSPFMVNTKQGKKNRFCATTLFSLSFPPPPPPIISWPCRLPGKLSCHSSVWRIYFFRFINTCDNVCKLGFGFFFLACLMVCSAILKHLKTINTKTNNYEISSLMGKSK